jgi:DNA-binding transcriptional ArsR family regulator
MVTRRSSRSTQIKLGSVLKAVADPSRRRILDLLAVQDMSVGRIASRFRISRPAVVKHLRVLRSAHLVSTRYQGRERIQSLNAEPLKTVEAWVSRFEGFWEKSLQQLKRQIETEP